MVDGKNKINAVRDVAIRGGKIAAVEANIDPAKAHKVVNVAGLYSNARAGGYPRACLRRARACAARIRAT